MRLIFRGQWPKGRGESTTRFLQCLQEEHWPFQGLEKKEKSRPAGGDRCADGFLSGGSRSTTKIPAANTANKTEKSPPKDVLSRKPTSFCKNNQAARTLSYLEVHDGSTNVSG